MAVVPVFQGEAVEPFYGHDGSFPADALSIQARRDWVEGCAHLSAANQAVQAAWEQAVSDLASLQLLDGSGAEQFMIVAGMPNYTGLFGRDAYVTALQTAALNPATLRGALQVVGRWNAETTDDLYDAQPGKVLHQRERGPLAQLGKTPFLHYYGDYSTPGLFLLAAAADLAHTGDLAFFRSLRDKLLGTIEWMEKNADSEGFYPYLTRSPQGIKNQSWKDSGDAVLYPDGRMVKNPIAICDVQGLYYAAKQAVALAFAAAGEHGRADQLLAEARRAEAAVQRALLDARGTLFRDGPRSGQASGENRGVGPGRVPRLRDRGRGQGRAPSPSGCWRPTCSAAGASARCPASTRPTTRSRTTSGRSGRRRTPSPPTD